MAKKSNKKKKSKTKAVTSPKNKELSREEEAKALLSKVAPKLFKKADEEYEIESDRVPEPEEEELEDDDSDSSEDDMYEI